MVYSWTCSNDNVLVTSQHVHAFCNDVDYEDYAGTINHIITIKTFGRQCFVVQDKRLRCLVML